MATVTCTFCGAQQEVDTPIAHPLCDRPECLQRARDWAWMQLLAPYIERKVEHGKTLFRLRAWPEDN